MACVEKLERFFFDAMLRGYASDQKANPHPKLAGWKQNVYEDAGLRLVDEWCKEGGRTIISAQGIPLWVMTYAGQYQATGIPLLKRALSHAYKVGFFYGGRGSVMVDPGNANIVYDNRYQGDFCKFSFFESIRSRDKSKRIGSTTVLGSHEGWGGLLVPINQLPSLM